MTIKIAQRTNYSCVYMYIFLAAARTGVLRIKALLGNKRANILSARKKRRCQVKDMCQTVVTRVTSL